MHFLSKLIPLPNNNFFFEEGIASNFIFFGKKVIWIFLSNSPKISENVLGKYPFGVILGP